MDRFEDHRGVIEDLLGPVDAVTQITTLAGAVRGNHVHNETVQYTYIVSGSMKFAWMESGALCMKVHKAGDLVTEAAGVPHAWQALEDTVVLVFTKGPRSGEAYESDTQRLEVPLL